MVVMSFNTQSCLNYIKKKHEDVILRDYPLMAKTVLDCGADIVGLNEIRGKGASPQFEAQTELLAQHTGIPHYFFAPAIALGPEKNNPYGNAILSRIPILRAQIIPIPDPDPKTGTRYYETRALLKAELEGGITVLVTHFGLNPDEQDSAVATVMQHITPEKCILMGDFNVTPEVGVLAPIRAVLKDTAEWFDRPKLSFPSDEPNRKIDYIFVSRDIQVDGADIPAVIASDHRPHTARIRIPELT